MFEKIQKNGPKIETMRPGDIFELLQIETNSDTKKFLSEKKSDNNEWHIRFIVTKDFLIYIDYKKTHYQIIEDHKIFYTDCIIDSGLFTGKSNHFFYQPSDAGKINVRNAVEKKVSEFLKRYGIDTKQITI